MINKLLCTTDGSKASEKAVEFACDLANLTNAELYFLTVDTVTDEELSHSDGHGWSHVLLEAADEMTNKEQYRAEQVAKGKNVKKYSCVTAQGKNIPATIIAYAEEQGCDHIVAGSTGKTGIARMLIGSVASDIVTKAHCPVTVVR